MGGPFTSLVEHLVQSYFPIQSMFTRFTSYSSLILFTKPHITRFISRISENQAIQQGQPKQPTQPSSLLSLIKEDVVTPSPQKIASNETTPKTEKPTKPIIHTNRFTTHNQYLYRDNKQRPPRAYLKNKSEKEGEVENPEKHVKRHRFQEKHILNILHEYHQQLTTEFEGSSLDRFVNKYLRAHREIGSNNRHVIVDTVYDMMRWMLLINYQVKQHEKKLEDRAQKYSRYSKKLEELQEKYKDELEVWRARYRTFMKMDLGQLTFDQKIPSHIRVSCPLEFFEMLCTQLGKDEAMDLCRVNNRQAPVFGRINPLKTTRNELIQKLKEYNIVCTETKHSSLGILFDKRYGLSQLEEYKNGLFEIQDEGSQMVAELVDAKEGQLVMDYCAGAGGKTLAIAHKLKGKGQIYMCDIRKHALDEAKKRLARAGVQNIQPLLIGHPHLEKLVGKLDWVLVDVPCSGSGTIRRSPELKYRITQDLINKFCAQQRDIFHDAFKYMKPKGRIVYSTCSILKQENEDQVDYFLKKFGLKIVDKYQCLPADGAMDGFYAVVMEKA